MSTRRVLGFAISLMEIIILITMFLSYGVNANGETINMMSALAPYSYVVFAFIGIGIITGIIGIKTEMNYLSAGANTMLIIGTVITLINYVNQYQQKLSLPIGFIIYIVATFILLIATFIYGFMDKKSSRPKIKKGKETVVNGGTQQVTNSLNMNMPVNNYQSLPVQMAEKKKAPMDVLLAGKDDPVPIGSTVVGGAGVQSHMAELGLQSINISKDNPTGAMPNMAPQMIQPQPMQQQVPQPEIPPIAPAPQIQPQDIPPIAPAPQMIQTQPMAQPQMQQQVPQGVPQQPMAKPDLLAGSTMSGQMDTSPFNSQPVQPGQGQFF